MADIWTIAIFGVPAIVIAVVLGLVWWYFKDETKKSAKNIVRGAQVGLVIVVAFMLFTMLAVPPSGPNRVTTMRLTLAEAATGDCLNFPDFSTDGACNPAAISGDIVINDADKKVALGLLSDYSANALYGAGSTTAFDTWSVEFTITRTDEGWLEEGASTKPTAGVSFSISGLEGWTVKSNTTETDIELIEENTLSVMQVGWEVSTSDIIGFTNPGSMCDLSPGGGTCTVRLTAYFNEDGLPRTIPFAIRTYSATVTISMQYGPTVTVPIELSFQSQA